LCFEGKKQRFVVIPAILLLDLLLLHIGVNAWHCLMLFKFHFTFIINHILTLIFWWCILTCGYSHLGNRPKNIIKNKS